MRSKKEVKKGEVLFELENRDLEANLAAQEAAYQIAVAKLKRLESMPRPEDLEAANADLKNTQSELEQAKHQYEMTQEL